MPKLVAMQRKYADLADRFKIIGVHEPEEGLSLSAVHRACIDVVVRLDRKLQLLEDMILDADEGMFMTYDPDGLGDMVLLDERGVVIACGDAAKSTLVRRLEDMRASVARQQAALNAAKSEDEVREGVRALYELDLPSARAAVTEYLEGCTRKNVAWVVEAVLKHGGEGGLTLLGGSAGLASEDKWRRDAVLEQLEANPQPGLTEVLSAFIETPRLKNKDLCRALTVMVKGDPTSRSVHRTVLRLSESRDTTIRRCAAELLGIVGTPKARARLLEILDKDRNVPVQRHAARGLAMFRDDDAKARLETIRETARAKSLREVAAKLLEDWE